MTANYITLDGKEIYLNEDQICLAFEDSDHTGYDVITMSCGERVIAKQKS